MTAEKFYKQMQYAQTVSQLVEEYDRADAEASKLTNFVTMAENMRAHDKALQYKDALAKVTETQAAITNVLKQKTGREAIVAVREFLDELTNKINLVNQLRQNSGQSKAAHEINVATGAYATPEARAASEKEVEENRVQYEKGVDLVGEMVPAVSSIILTGAPSVPTAGKLALV